MNQSKCTSKNLCRSPWFLSAITVSTALLLVLLIGVPKSMSKEDLYAAEVKNLVEEVQKFGQACLGDNNCSVIDHNQLLEEAALLSEQGLEFDIENNPELAEVVDQHFEVIAALKELREYL